MRDQGSRERRRESIHEVNVDDRTAIYGGEDFHMKIEIDFCEFS